MCKRGDTVEVMVLKDEPNHWGFQDIDRCIAPLVNALNTADIYTASCCCGHGEELGYIWLRDGRVLIVLHDATKDSISALVTKAAG